MFTAIFEIYNLVSVIQSDRTELGDMKDRIVSLNSVLSKEFKETFMSKRTNTDAGEDDTNPPKRARTSHGGQRDNTGNVLRCGDHVYDDRQVVDAFTKAGYTLESDDEDEDGWAPLNQVKQTGTLSFDLD
jgi:hypothetical protein